MSTRATITVADEHDSFDIYQHHDGYPDGPLGLVRHIAMAKRLARDLPRFEAGDFAAAVIAVLNHLCIADLLRFPRCSVLQGTASGRHTP